MKGITTMAAAPLSHFLAARRRCPVTVERNMFADLADAFPRAWACLGAVALAYGAGGGRWPYRAPAAPVPLPVAEFHAVCLCQMRPDVRGRQPLGIQADDGLVEPRQPAGVLQDKAEQSCGVPLRPAAATGPAEGLASARSARDGCACCDQPYRTAGEHLRVHGR